jgi:hypothetical protein
MESCKKVLLLCCFRPRFAARVIWLGQKKASAEQLTNANQRAQEKHGLNFKPWLNFQTGQGTERI